ncbi:hypoxanthine phosphoribosyltransferase [Miniphocaeibacter massiliensis]|uniref:hypoxanthine phosphoribosyltransferase n=1 Tax=Miniphocaeibacter massiliensis TaxID=2041841 RepID=UPI000C08A2B9|nr:hypoxanthine phosphoribosyltransferase [Miniphocaeibacter massiliensis]
MNNRNNFKEILVSESEIDARLEELSKEIYEVYKNDEDDLVVVGILRGAVIFMAELILRLDLDLHTDYMAVSSYGSSSVSSGVVRILKDLEEDIKGKNILIVEDIIDTGLTLKYLTKNLKERGAKSVRIATLLDKPERRKEDVNVDFIGFEIPDEFVVGYGLDYDQKYRNLPFVASLKEEVYS